MVNLGNNVANLYLYTIHIDIYFDKNAFIPTGSTAGAYSGICPGGSLILFSLQGGAQHPLGHENPLKSIGFTGPGGGAEPQ